MSDLIHTGTTSAMVEGARAEGVMEAVARAVGVMAVAARACYFGDTYSIHDKRRILPNLSSSCDAHQPTARVFSWTQTSPRFPQSFVV